MTRERRMEILKELEEKCNGPVVSYITSDRRMLETKIATDIFPMFHKHLMETGKQERINLFLYSTGGITIAGYGLVNLFREFCDNFNVIIPFKALSCATLICLGANNIIMTPIGQLGPIDPSVEHPLGPMVQIPGQPMQQIAPVNVEEVNGFIDMAKKEFNLNEEDSMKKAFELLVSRIHPLTLGSVQRTREQIAFLAKTLMKNHYTDDKIEHVVQTLTRDRYSHDYIISRNEAKNVLGLEVVEPDTEETKDIMDLFNEYSNILELDNPYNPETFLGGTDSKIGIFNRGIIESCNFTHVFRTKKEVGRVSIPQPGSPIPGVGYQERLLEEGWVEDNSI